MNIGTSESPQKGIGINGYFSRTNLTIYGQSLDEATAGQLSIYTDAAPTVNGNGILIQGTYTQHSGNVTINSSHDAISVNGDITINGGKLDATTSIGLSTLDDIYALRCTNNITMNGGILNAIGNSYGHAGKSANGIYGTVTMTGGTLTATSTATVYGTPSTGIKGNATLSWTSAADRFTASSYDGTVTIADGQAFTDEDGNIYSGTLSSDDKTAIAGKTLQPVLADILTDNASNTTTIQNLADGLAHDIMLLGRTLYKDGDWNTLCLPFAMTAEQIAESPLAGADIRALSTTIEYEGATTGFNPSNGILTLNFTPAAPADGAVTAIQAGVPYIVNWGTKGCHPNTDIENPVFTGVTVTTGNNDVAFPGGSFKGTYSSTTLPGGDASNLYLGSDNTLYWPSTDRKFNAFRGYFHVNLDAQGGGSGVRAFNLNFGEDDATGIVSTTNYTNSAGAGWYDLSGRKLQGKPTAKGLYINNGRKVVIK